MKLPKAKKWRGWKSSKRDGKLFRLDGKETFFPISSVWDANFFCPDSVGSWFLRFWPVMMQRLLNYAAD